MTDSEGKLKPDWRALLKCAVPALLIGLLIGFNADVVFGPDYKQEKVGAFILSGAVGTLVYLLLAVFLRRRGKED